MKALKKVRNGKIKKNTLTVKIVHLGTFVEKIKFLDILPFKKQKECLSDKIEMSENGQL